MEAAKKKKKKKKKNTRHLRECGHACVYVCVCACVRARACVCVSVCVFLSVWLPVCMQVCMWVLGGGGGGVVRIGVCVYESSRAMHKDGCERVNSQYICLMCHMYCNNLSISMHDRSCVLFGIISDVTNE